MLFSYSYIISNAVFCNVSISLFLLSLTIVSFVDFIMSQSQHSDFTSSLYDVEFDDSAYPTSSNCSATPTESQQIIDILEPSFLRPAIPSSTRSIFERVGPARRKLYFLYDEMTHNDWVEWWLQTDYGSKSKISWDSNHLSDIWKHYVQVAHSVDGTAKVMCKRCSAILEHPYTIKKDTNGKDERHGTTTMTRHIILRQLLVKRLRAHASKREK